MSSVLSVCKYTWSCCCLQQILHCSLAAGTCFVTKTTVLSHTKLLLLTLLLSTLFSSSSPFSGQLVTPVYTWPATSSSTSLQLTPLACKSSWTVDCQVFLGQPFLFLPSAGIQSIALWAGRSGAAECPANRNLLSRTVCLVVAPLWLCPVRFSAAYFCVCCLVLPCNSDDLS